MPLMQPLERKAYLQSLERKFLDIVPENPAIVYQKVGLEEPQGGVAKKGGVYGIWEDENLRYFGETCNLRDRLFDLVVSGRHHALNLLLADRAKGKAGKEKVALFSQPPFTVSWMTVEIGRAELEEYMVLKNAAGLKNHKGGRFALRSDKADWVEMIIGLQHAP